MTARTITVCLTALLVVALIVHRVWCEYRPIHIGVFEATKLPAVIMDAVRSGYPPPERIEERTTVRYQLAREKLVSQKDLGIIRRKLAWHFPFPYPVRSISVESTTQVIAWLDDGPIISIDLKKEANGDWSFDGVSGGEYLK